MTCACHQNGNHVLCSQHIACKQDRFHAALTRLDHAVENLFEAHKQRNEAIRRMAEIIEQSENLGVTADTIGSEIERLVTEINEGLKRL